MAGIPATTAGLLGIGFCCLVLYVISLYSSSVLPFSLAGSFSRPTTSPNPVDKITRRHEISVDPELMKILQRAKMTTTAVGKGTVPPSEMVIVTTVNEAWAKPGSILDLFLESFWNGDGPQELVRHLVIVALDQKKAHQYCQAVHPHSYALTTPRVNFTGTAASYKTDEYLRIVWRAMEFYTSVLSLGFDFVFTDADIVWLRNPFPHFQEQVDFQVGCDFFNGQTRNLRFVHLRRFFRTGSTSRLRLPSLETRRRLLGSLNAPAAGVAEYWYLRRSCYKEIEEDLLETS